ncbi:class I SAM-dependent methyltransferase [Nisaea sp.]|uniref:class I SAM-dependent methyltransferase n=1 Tax=Nisaea sp. TaxID=2024842 RepID=UPI003B52B44C
MTDHEMADYPLPAAGLRPHRTDPFMPWTRAVLVMLRAVRVGELTVHAPNGESYCFRGPDVGPRAEVRLGSDAVSRKLLLGGDVRFGEAYMDGNWETPDLPALIEFGAANRRALSRAIDGTSFVRLVKSVQHFTNRNTKRGSRRNIAHHYDIGNAFYGKWLDPSMTYSAAVFDCGEEELEAAQRRKYRRIADMLRLEPGQTVLEIGCGWGGFASVAARDYGARVVGLTLSQEQHDYAIERAKREGIADKVSIQLCDYRDIDGRYDHIASIEMFEAVGEKYWPAFFDQVRSRLTDTGHAALQIITIDDADFEDYRRNPDFIQKYIFPGGMLPSVSKLKEQFRASGLECVADDGFGSHYARTLAMWRERFHARWHEIAPLGFDERFRRMWDYYLCYCEGGFRAGNIDVRQIALKHA